MYVLLGQQADAVGAGYVAASGVLLLGVGGQVLLAANGLYAQAAGFKGGAYVNAVAPQLNGAFAANSAACDAEPVCCREQAGAAALQVAAQGCGGALLPVGLPALVAGAARADFGGTRFKRGTGVDGTTDVGQQDVAGADCTRAQPQQAEQCGLDHGTD